MKTRYLVYGFTFCILLLLYFNEVFIQHKVFSERDLSVFFYPYIHCWVENIRNTEFPLWNPFIMCGEPLLAAVQPAVLYPLSFLYLIFPITFAFNLIIVIHFLLAGVFTFLLLKEMGASDEASAISAIIFTFSGYLLSVHNLLSTLLSVTWLPLVLVFYLRAIHRNTWRYAIVAGLSLYCMFAGGGMEVLIMTFGLLLLTALFPYYYHDGEAGATGGLGRRLGWFGISFMWFLFFGAVQIIPFLELLYHSIRSFGISYQEAVLWSFRPQNLLYLFLPDIFWKGQEYYWQDQSWLKTIYTGMLPFLLGCFLGWEKGKRRLFFFLLITGALLLSLGKYNPLYRVLFTWVPVFTVIRYPVKFLLIVIFFLCLAAGLGWDHFQQNKMEKKIQMLTFSLFFVFGFLLSIVFLWVTLLPDVFWDTFHLDSFFAESKFPHAAIFHNLKRMMIFAIVGSTWLYIIMRKQRMKPFGSYGIMLLLLLDLFGGNYGFFQAADKEILLGETENLKVLKADNSLYRIYVQQKIMQLDFPYRNHEEYLKAIQDVFVPNTLMERGYFDIRGFSILSLKNYYKVLTLVQSAPLPDSTNLLNMMNVKYVLWSEELHCPGYELIRKDKVFLYKNTNYLPRAFLVKNHTVFKDEETFRQTIQSPDFDPAETVLFKKEPKKIPQLLKSMDHLEDSVQIDEYRSGMVKLHVISSRYQFLVLSDTFYPGWKAFVDGEITPIYEADFAFRAIAMPPGEHSVTFQYTPFSFTLGAGISVGAFLALLAFLRLQRK